MFDDSDDGIIAELAAGLAIDREGEDYKEALRAELKGKTSSVLPDTK